MEDKVNKEIAVFPKETPRVLIAGSPFDIPNWKLHHIVENSGAVEVCEESCVGTRNYRN